jgi:glycosyltransferase involved in cell wall biosynthesis
MRVSLPVVGTDVPGIREAVGEEGAAFLAPPGDAAAFARLVVMLARDPDLRTAVGRKNAELLRARQAPEATSRVYARLLAEALR